MSEDEGDINELRQAKTHEEAEALAKVYKDKRHFLKEYTYLPEDGDIKSGTYGTFHEKWRERESDPSIPFDQVPALTSMAVTRRQEKKELRRNIRRKAVDEMNAYFRKRDEGSYIISGAPIGKPDTEYVFYEYPYPVVYEVVNGERQSLRAAANIDDDAVKKLAVEARGKEWADEMHDRTSYIRNFAKKTGRWDLVQWDPNLSVEDATEIIARKNHIEEERAKANIREQEYNKMLIEQREQERATGKLGTLYDPEATPEYLKEILNRGDQISHEEGKL